MNHALNGCVPSPLDNKQEKTVRAGERLTLGLVSMGHFFSHYFCLVLPPLFPLLKHEFGASYLELGFVMTAYMLLGGVMQSPVGFLVDRISPRTVLLAGLSINSCAIILMSMVGTYLDLLALAVIAGLGNSVFHPADYAIINGSIRVSKLGRAFSIHTFSGFFGGACAPVSILFLAQWTNWRTALFLVGLAGLLGLLVMVWRWDVLNGESRATPSGYTVNLKAVNATVPIVGVQLLLSPPVLLFLVFFILYGMSSGGLIAFIVTGLIELHGISHDEANSALAGHLFGVVGGILLAGVIADHFTKHIVTVAFSLLLVVIATVLPIFVPTSSVLLILLMALSGVGLGAVLPARDLMLRALTPPGNIGKVFGFVFVGYSLGVSVAPILFGWFLDVNKPALVFSFAALFAVLALMATVAAHCMTPNQLNFGKALEAEIMSEKDGT